MALALLGSLLALTGFASESHAQDGGVSTVHISQVPDGDGAARLVVSIESPDDVAASAITFEANLDADNVRPVLTADNVPSCRIFTPWAGACGPTGGGDELNIAAFSFSGGSDVVVEVPLIVSGDPALPTVVVSALSNEVGLDLPFVVSVDDELPAFLSDVGSAPIAIGVACDTRRVKLLTDATIDAAATVDEAGQSLPATVTGFRGAWSIDPGRWPFQELILSVTDDLGSREETFAGYAWCDFDGDGTVIWEDNCPGRFNPLQTDRDGDGVGDACEPPPCGLRGLETLREADYDAVQALADAGILERCWIGDEVDGESRVGHVTLAGKGDALTALATLDGLTSVDLSEVGLTQVPDELTGLPLLESLDLDGNQLTSFPAGLSTSLRSLSLQDNNISEVPASIGTFSQLQRLALDGNQITAVSAEIQNLRKLETLHLADNQLSDLPDLSGMEELDSLGLSGNLLTEPPSYFPNDGDVWVDLRENQITGDLTSFFEAYYAVDRDFDDDSSILLNDGPGFNDCVTVDNPNLPTIWGERPLDFECGRAGVISGILRADSGGPLFGGWVCAERPLLRDVCFYTEADGSFYFDVGVGNVRVTAEHWSLQEDPIVTEWIGLGAGEFVDDLELQFGVADVVVPDPGSADLEPFVVPTGGAIAGTALDADGTAVSGAEVCAVRGLVGDLTCATSRSDGSFMVADLAPGNYEVELRVDGVVVATHRWAGISATQAVSGLELHAG